MLSFLSLVFALFELLATTWRWCRESNRLLDRVGAHLGVQSFELGSWEVVGHAAEFSKPVASEKIEDNQLD